MSFAFRVYLLLLALSLNFISPAFAQVQSTTAPHTVAPAPSESAARALVEKYFARYAAKDLDGLLSLWSAQAPDYAAVKENLRRQFAVEDYRLSLPAISRVKLTDERAMLRAAVKLTITDLKSQQQREQQITRNFALVKEAGTWKVWRYAPAERELAEALLKAKTEAARAALLVEEKELVTAELVRALIQQGNALAEQGDFPQALASQRLAQKLAAELGDRVSLAQALNNLGNVYWAQGDYAPAEQSFQQSLALSKTLGDQTAVAATLRNLGNLQFVQGNWEQAAKLFRQGLQLSERLGDRLGVARGLGSLGVVTDSQGNFAQALAYYQQALKQFETLEDQLGVARTLGNIAIVYHEQGNYAQSIAHHQKSLALFEAGGDKAGGARTLHNIASVQLDQGNYAQALAAGQQVLQIREQLGDRPGVAKTLAHLGNVHFEQGQHEQALAYYQKSLALRETLKDKEGIADALNNIARVEVERGQYAAALEHFQQSLALREAIGFKYGSAATLGSLAYTYRKQGQHAQALEFAERAATLARQIGDYNTLSHVLYTVGAAQRALDKPTQARSAFEEAVAITENLRTQIAGGEEQQQRYFESKLAPYHALLELLISENKPAEALQFAERTKARTLLDVLRQGRLDIQKALTAAEREQEWRLKASLTQLNTQLSSATQADQPDPQRVNELKARLEKARLAYETFQTTLYAAHPELRTQRGEAPIIKTEALAALLPDAESALLEYVVADEQTYLFTITKAANHTAASVRVFALPVKHAELTRQIESFRRQLAGRDLGFRAAAGQLYDLLLKPAQAQLKGKTRLVIVPDDKLWELPFQALLTAAKRFLLEEVALTYAPSLTVLREMTKRPPAYQPATLLALGNPALGKETRAHATLALRDGKLAPLPEAEQEVKALGQLYGATRSKVYVGAEAREDRAKTEAAHTHVLHFATHGVLNNAAPLYSHLVLTAGTKDEDGLLEAWELMQMDLQAELAVLSACETARGRYGAGEGMIGLTWALFVAGVPSTVVSQWKVESASTRELMLNFHRALQSPPAAAKTRPTKAEALRQAALKLLKDPETNHPFYWAGFVLIGDGR